MSCFGEVVKDNISIQSLEGSMSFHCLWNIVGSCLKVNLRWTVLFWSSLTGTTSSVSKEMRARTNREKKERQRVNKSRRPEGTTERGIIMNDHAIKIGQTLASSSPS